MNLFLGISCFYSRLEWQVYFKCYYSPLGLHWVSGIQHCKKLHNVHLIYFRNNAKGGFHFFVSMFCFCIFILFIYSRLVFANIFKWMLMYPFLCCLLFIKRFFLYFVPFIYTVAASLKIHLLICYNYSVNRFMRSVYYTVKVYSLGFRVNYTFLKRRW